MGEQREPDRGPEPGPWTRRAFLLGACSACGLLIAFWEKARRGGRTGAPDTEPSQAPSPMDPGLRRLLRLLGAPDEELARHAFDVAQRCWEYPDQPAVRAGVHRLARIGLARQGEEADRILHEAAFAFWTLGEEEGLAALRAACAQRPELRATRAFLEDPRAERRGR